MLSEMLDILKQDQAKWETVRDLFQRKSIPAKTILLNEGEIAKNIYFIKNGSLRLWFNNDSKDITFQFFFENQAVSSIESFLEQKPSMFNLESIETTELLYLSKNGFEKLLAWYPELKDGFFSILLKRLGNYAQLFLSRIKDKPQKRYKELLENNPEIIERIPQHYIASYLGITPISLSRIRNKK